MLRPGGLLVLLEPTHSLWTTVQRLRGQDPDEGHSQHEITWRETYVRAFVRNGLRTFWKGRFYPSDTGRMPLTSAIKRRAHDDLRAARQRRSPLAWVHEHAVGGGGSMIALARKDRHVDRRGTPDIRIVDPMHQRSTRADREAFAPLRDILERAAQGIRRPSSQSQ